MADDSQEQPLVNLTQNSKSVVVFEKNDRAVSCDTIVVLTEIKKNIKWCELNFI